MTDDPPVMIYRGVPAPKGDPAPPTGYVRVDIARMLLAALAPFADVAHEEAVEAVRIAKEVGL